MLALLLHLLLLIPPAASCSGLAGFATDGDAAALFQSYRLYDFSRILPVQNWAVVRARDDRRPVKILRDLSASDDWVRRNDLRMPIYPDAIPMLYSRPAVSIANSSIANSSDPSNPSDAFSALVFTSDRLDNRTQRCAGVDFTAQDLTAVSLRVRARITGAPGVCAAFFVYQSDTQEADFEILTRDDPANLRLNVQPSLDIRGQHIPGAAFNASLAPHAWSDWVDYRLDWVPGKVVWYAGGVLLQSTTTNVPTLPCRLVLSLWGMGNSWTGDMPVGASASLEVRTIEIMYNRTSAPDPQEGDTEDADAADAQTVCRVDQGQRPTWTAPAEDVAARLARPSTALLTLLLSRLLYGRY